MEIEFKAKLWKWDARQEKGWMFVSVPKQYFEDLFEIASSYGRGFKSLRVEATAGSTTWRTSIFPSKQDKEFVLPMKKSVREKEHLEEGHTAQVIIKLLDI